MLTSLPVAVLRRVDNDNYPVYDTNSLYNTNENFDYGGFRQLQEDQSLVSSQSTLFTYRFSDPGVYTFVHSSNSYKRFYVNGMQRHFLTLGLICVVYSWSKSCVRLIQLVHLRMLPLVE